ncbi:hypothetical protein [Microbacterium sp. NPDC087592]|uniref:hypothetical protein n=1 Tax=Microbacterium sp. NPDC087592 TaxID=3364193 RepID=UPI00381070B5
MKTLFDSLVRTYVPWLAGVIITFLVSLGVPLDPEVQPALLALLMLAASAAYYWIARLLETHMSPKFGWMLGLAKPPVYEVPEPVLIPVEGLSRDEILARLEHLTPSELNASIQAAASRVNK